MCPLGLGLFVRGCMLVVRLALAVVAWCLVRPLLCAVPLLLAPGPLGLFSSLALVPACSLGPGSAALSVGPLFSAGSVFFSPRPSAACLSPLMCRCCPPGAHGLCGGCASACSCWGCSCLCGSPVRALVLALGCLGALVARGVCCLVAVLLPGACLACLAFPLGAGPCLWLFSALVLRLG